MSTARSEILTRIRAAIADVPAGETPEQVVVERNYRTSDPSPKPELVAQFHERVAEYKATVHLVSASELPGAIAAICSSRGIRKLVVPADLPEEWLPKGVVHLRDNPLTSEQLDASDAVLTTCALGIAQTGTIVLDGGPGQGRRAITLVPDCHLCVVRDDQIVGLVPEAVGRLHDSAGSPGRPITWISGPSATSDIELNRVEGVHGPRTLEVLIVTGESVVG